MANGLDAHLLEGLVEGLLAAGKIRAGARVIYSHSETSRSVWLFAGFQPFVRLQASEIDPSFALSAADTPPGDASGIRALR